jgi:transposase InsO family protein
VRVPAKSTVHAVLDRHGLVSQARKRNRTNKAMGTPLSPGLYPNDLWCADYKGAFQLGDGRYCYPLTVTEHASRSRMCEAHELTKEINAFDAFARLFQDRGLPGAIRSGNGLPFASSNGLYNLSKLSVWWLRLGIDIERIQPGKPQQNGRHERMQLTLKTDTTKPAAFNFLQQQERFDRFVEVYNNERPHQGWAAPIRTSSIHPRRALPTAARGGLPVP